MGFDYFNLAIPKPEPRHKRVPKPLKRSAFKRHKGRRTMERLKAWRLAKELAFAASGGLCMAKIQGVCAGDAVDPHHRRKRSHGGKDVVENCLPVCRECHDWIEQNPR